MSETTEFSQMIMAHSRRIFAVAYHFLQRADEAEDVVQDISIKLWQMRQSLPAAAQLEPYILVMTRNLCIDRIRSRHDDVEFSDVGQCLESAQLADDDLVEHRDRLNVTIQLMRQLPDDQSRALRLKVFDELENAQIARLMATSEDNVRQLLSRARRKLKELALKQGVI